MDQISKGKFLKAVLFIFLGMPGSLLFVFCSTLLLGISLYPTIAGSFPSPIYLVIMSALGLFMALMGAGKLKQWLYSAAFLTIPISFFLFAIIDNYFHFTRGKGLLELGIFMSIVSFLISKAVSRHYNKIN